MISNGNSTNTYFINSNGDMNHGTNEINNKNDSKEISQQAIRFAETRFAFPPFIIKFQQAVDENIIIKSLVSHFASKYDFHLNFAGHRLKNKNELVIFTENRESFAMLYDNDKWPTLLNAFDFTKIIPNHLPPQFSIMLRNVPMDKDMNSLLSDIQDEYPEVINAYRITNKNNPLTSFVRLDIKCTRIIDELLKKKFLYIDNLRISATEYLSPAKMLICTKCYRIEHFRSTCKSSSEFCKTCGESFKDINEHKKSCSNKPLCIRCHGPHGSNDYRCPEVKSYRAQLTKALLSSTHSAAQSQHQRQQTPVSLRPTDHNFPVLKVNNTRYMNGNAYMGNADKRIDELFVKMKEINKNLDRLIELNNNSVDQLACAQQLIAKHEHVIQLQQLDISFQHDFLSQFISPVCQMVIDIIPELVKQNVIKDKILLCPPVSTLAEKLTNELTVWTNRFLNNENLKTQLLKDFNLNNHHFVDEVVYYKDHPPSITQ